MTSTRDLNVWVEVSEKAYAHNLRFLRQRVGADVELSAVIKANAYGHGFDLVAGLAARHGADSFCVHALDEALRLRELGFAQDVLILGPVPPSRLDEVLAHNFRLVVYDRETVQRLAQVSARCDRRVRMHLKLETGTYRQGIDADHLTELAALIVRHPKLVIEGAYTHFANIEDTTRRDYAEQQLAGFMASLGILGQVGIEPPIRHAACSAATLVMPRTCFEMVRVGVSQYGFWSSKETFLSYRLAHPDAAADLEPVLSWKTRITQLKEVPAGAFVGYGCTYQTTRKTRLAVLPVGYSDGYDRGLSNQAYVLVRGRRAPVRGRICMNLSLVDVTDIPEAQLGDEVVLIGQQGEQRITAGDLAGLIGTIHYEIVARINWDLPRLRVD